MTHYRVTVTLVERAASNPGGETERVAVTYLLATSDYLVSRDMALVVAVRRACARFVVEKVLSVDVTEVTA